MVIFSPILCHLNKLNFTIERYFQLFAITSQNERDSLKLLKSFSANVPLLYPLKILENRRFSDTLKEYRSETFAENSLI